MDTHIVNNLIEYWDFIGGLHTLLVTHESYRSIYVSGSLWPHRIYSVNESEKTLNEIISRSGTGEIPDIILLPKPNSFEHSFHLKPMFTQLNMALSVAPIKQSTCPDSHITLVRNYSEVKEFAETASEAFGSSISAEMLAPAIHHSEKLQLYIYKVDAVVMGCGALFIDSNNNAGFHTVGTVPSARGRGVASKITKHLIAVAQNAQVTHCVLHASPMGKGIYAQLGFKGFGEIATYKIE